MNKNVIYLHFIKYTKLESNYCLLYIDNGIIHCLIDVSFRHSSTLLIIQVLFINIYESRKKFSTFYFPIIDNHNLDFKSQLET